MVNVGMTQPKIKNRNGFSAKRITEFDNTPVPKSCQRESFMGVRAGRKYSTETSASMVRHLTERGTVVIGMGRDLENRN